MDNWLKLHIPVLILSWSYPPSAFILLPLFFCNRCSVSDATYILKTDLNASR